jgi:cellulose synthase/poly-beta-1,6-N-acetylglucosamine synthase-like glycosyltransferase
MGVQAAAAIGRSRASRGALTASPSIDPWTAEFADSGAGYAGGCPEIDCVRSLLAADVIDDAEHRAAALGVGADRVLIAAGRLSEETYLRALGDALGVEFEPLDGIPRGQCPLNDERLIESAAAGMLPLAVDDDLYLVVAPRAAAARNSRMPVVVIPVPTQGPRTKPKALNVALPFARGTFTVIYDAEDRPEPNQLRYALQAFRAGGDDLACVQARLCIDNSADSWLARLFTAEYAGQFDVFLPGLAALHLPLPLGGSSNHFYTAILREVGGWDPYNVTEDADLGMRLARFGYRSDVIDSTTYE